MGTLTEEDIVKLSNLSQEDIKKYKESWAEFENYIKKGHCSVCTKKFKKPKEFGDCTFCWWDFRENLGRKE